MDIGSVADWLNCLATGILAGAAIWFSKRQFEQQRDSELRVVLKSIKNENGKFCGYELRAVNNSEGKCVILQNTTPEALTQARLDVFRDRVSDDDQHFAATSDQFLLDKEILAQQIETLWCFSSYRRGRIPKNSHAGSTDAMDWYFYDAVSDQHYQVVIRQSQGSLKRLVASMKMQTEPFATEAFDPQQ